MVPKPETGDEDLEKRLKSLFKGQRELVYVDNIPDGKPHWFDEEKFEAGRQFVKKYRGGVFFAHLTSLTLLIYSPQVLKPLIFTGKSETPRKSYARYISTTLHVLSWYKGDIWQSGSTARKSLQKVRQYHTDAALRVNSPEIRPLVDMVDISNCGKQLHKGRPLLGTLQKDFSTIPECPYLHLLNESYSNFVASSTDPVPYFNQLDMSGTQFAFMGLVLLYPEKFGMARATEQELEGFLHLWRCIGWILGIDDRFNFCQFESLPEARRWTNYFLKILVIPSLKISLTAEYEHMSRAVVEGSRFYVGASYESIYLFVTWVMGLSMPLLEKHVSPTDRLGFQRLAFIFGLVGNLPFGNCILNGLNFLVLKLIIDPPLFWPRRFRPPTIKGLKELWIAS